MDQVNGPNILPVHVVTLQTHRLLKLMTISKVVFRLRLVLSEQALREVTRAVGDTVFKGVCPESAEDAGYDAEV